MELALMEEEVDEMFDLESILPEIYTSHPVAAVLLPPSNANINTQIPDDASTKHKLWNSCNAIHGQETITSTKQPRLISFDNSNTTPSHHPHYNNSRQIIKFSSSEIDEDAAVMSHSKRMRVNCSSRSLLQAQDHLMAERKRREKLTQLFITLSKLVPGLKKLDKASLLEDAIKYLKSLQERVRALEEQETHKIIRCVDEDEDQDDNSCNWYTNESTSRSHEWEIKARISNDERRHVLIKICCKKLEMGLMSRIPSELEKMKNLSVIDMRVMPFGALIHITILAKMHTEFCGTVKDIVELLQHQMPFFNS